MLSYKNNQTIPPLYDYYVETDLDSLDDQPVDYSKKYSDQDSYEGCRRRKSNVNSNQFPTSEVSQSMKPSCRNSTDELKVYCIEGTPVTISSASSFSDLRDIGANNLQQKSEVKLTFPSVNDDEIPQDSLEVKKGIETYSNKKEEPLLSKGKDDMSREVKSVSFRSGDDISKASSPLMFSRSSSVGSLNSFEQQSIADDRSSVSAFSALTSGLISPSDLPDSPGEVMSPVLTDKANSPKMESSKANSDNESENIELCEKAKVISDHDLEDESKPTFSNVQIPKSNDYMPIESYKSIRNSDEDENEIMAEQLEFSHDSSAEIDEVFSNPEYERDSFVLKSERDSSEQLSVKSDGESDTDDILLQQCIQLGMPNKSENKSDINGPKKVEYLTHSRNISDSQIHVKNEALSLNEDSFSGRGEVIQPSVKSTICEEPCVQAGINAAVLHQSHPLENDQLTTDPVKSDDDSDGDDAEMLQRCIELGMPKGSPDSIATNAAHYSPHSTNHNMIHDLCDPTPVKFDDDSDGDDILLQNCIKLGLPNKSGEKGSGGHPYKQMEHHNACGKSNGPQVVKNTYPVKSQRNQYVNEDSSLLPHGVPARTQKESQEKRRLHSRMFSKPNCPPHSVNCSSPRVAKKMYPMKSEGDSDGDDDDILLQDCIQRGMPKESWEKKKLHPRVFNKPVYPSHSVNHCSPSALRDNCPDGISDADEDDDMLANCIRAGMPSPKIVDDVHNRLHNSQTGNVSIKLQSCNRSYLPNTTSESKKVSLFRLPPPQPHAPVHSSATWISRTSFIDVDSMRIYRTEDTPILSPSASISDLSSLSFNESFLNNSRNSDCSSESDDDELLLQCIRSGMPEAKRAVA